MAGNDLYHRDYYRWTREQAARLRALAYRQEQEAGAPGEGSGLDVAHLAEEVAQAGRLELNRVTQYLTSTLIYVLEAAWLQHAPANRRWRGEAKSAAREAYQAFTDGMRPDLNIREIWADAVEETNVRLRETGEEMLPADVSCPLALDDLLARRLDANAAVSRVRAALLGDDGQGPCAAGPASPAS
ncbi:DUF29 family protein [Rhodovibrio salinarum]|uniref:DUF29 domain-containing protein n=1 Tax=Rhodovibrio salinarum TaxID=1087 RepID=A0A934UYJ3_9PROT|nr:DUF29 family protein [Rhodovibrio salinarum]MBK1695684.1 DUF29 domain-containing protein [Rhodovibrio salinarum]